jgi:hypothetical protein
VTPVVLDRSAGVKGIARTETSALSRIAVARSPLP